MVEKKPLTLVYQFPMLSQNAQAIMRGVGAYVRPHTDWHLRVVNERLDTVVPMLKDLHVDGIFASPETVAEQELVIKSGIPCILIRSARQQNVVPYLTANNRLLGRMAAEHFIEKGFTSFAYYTLNSARFWSIERLEGFAERVKQAGGTLSVFEPPAGSRSDGVALSRWPLSTWTRNAGHLHEWLRSLPRPSGLFASEDGAGYDVIEAAREVGINVPEQLAVLSTYNDLTRCLLANPPLSSIALDLEQNGYNAAALLHRIILGEEKMAGQQLLNEPTHIVTRQSTDILAVNDPDLADALHFIRTNCNKPIRVADVVRQTATSRRGLELKFRNHIRHSIADEIVRVKIEQAAIMLLESDVSMERIADCLTFCSASHMRKLFMKFKGVSPYVFRKQHRKT